MHVCTSIVAKRQNVSCKAQASLNPKKCGYPETNEIET